MIKTTLDVAKATSKKHKNVLSDARSVCKMTNIEVVCCEYMDSRLRMQTYLLLPRDALIVLFSRYKRFDLVSAVMNGRDFDNVVQYRQRPEIVFSDVVKNMFSKYMVIEQFPVFGGKYRIDWYIPELKLAIEYDEHHHKYHSEDDAKRQAEIEAELGCKFARYTDF